ncbi:MAG: flagellar biosynthesis regulator FlaF [Caulobacteraceae bacterium]|nr:flagellar biosynthesis regulator FlaF [Caulobacter sp.]
MSLKAYQSAAQQAESPRELEYRLFAEVTRSLIEASRKDLCEVGARMEALDWNRRLWEVLAGDCALPENRLDDSTRAQVISLALFVRRHTPEVASGRESFDPLVEVNRTVMQGLAPPPSERTAA